MKLFFIIFLNITNLIYSQSLIVKGVVFDNENNLLDGVSIYINDTNEGTISNELGEFKFIFNNENVKITFSYLGYQTLEIDVNSIKDYSNLSINLIPFEDTLEEVVISSIPITELLERVIQKSKKKLKSSAILTTYNREILKIDSTYCFFADGLSTYHLLGERKKVKSKMYIKENRVINVGCEEQEKFIKSNPFGYHVFNKVRESFKKSRFLDVVFRTAHKYEFTLKTKTIDKDVIYNVIEFEPKPDYNSGYTFRGYVIYDAKSELILELFLKKASNKLEDVFEIQSFIFDFSAIDIEQKISYRINNGKYILVYNKGYQKYYVGKIFGRKFNNTYTLFNDLTVIDYKEGFFKFDKSKLYKDDYLFSLGNRFSNPFWENISISESVEEKLFKESYKKRTF